MYRYGYCITVERAGNSMDNFEPKKLALIRILQILKKYSDDGHPLTQEDIASLLEKDYGIVVERKAIGRNINLLKDAGYEIASGRAGSYLEHRDFEDSELRLLIDGVLCSKHITAKYSADLINRLCELSNKYFRSRVKNIYSVNERGKTDNKALFYNIDVIDSAIEKHLRIEYDYNKIGTDKKYHKTSHQAVSPYQLILHNQRYYLMAYCERWGNMVFHRLESMTDMVLTEEKATDIRTVPGYENGIDYKKLSSALPYMYTDKPERIDMIADKCVVDQIVDWFGYDVKFEKIKENEQKIKVTVTASPYAMEHWAMQYINFVEVTSPASVRESILKSLQNGMDKYKRGESLC